MDEYICPNCKNPIYDEDALLCHFCGESLQRAGQGFMGRVRYANHRVFWFYLSIMILAAFVLLMIR